MVDVYIALGSNLKQPVWQLRRALHSLKKHSAIDLVDISRLFYSNPVGPEQNKFFNLVCRLETTLLPYDLFLFMQNIEKLLGRVASVRWGPRVIDLDLIYWSGVEIGTDILNVPHKLCFQRIFVLQPWLDVAGHDEILAQKIRKYLLLCNTLGEGQGLFLGNIFADIENTHNNC